MAKVILTLKVMGSSPDVDMTKVESSVKEKIVALNGEGDMRFKVVPVAFGINSLEVIFVHDEAKGATDVLEDDIGTIEGVESVEVIDVRRAIG